MEHENSLQAAQLLLDTWRADGRIEQLPEACRPTDRAEGYAIQAQIALIAQQTVFGWKIAATSQAGQKHIGVDGPMAGRLLSNRAQLDAGGDAKVPCVPFGNNGMQVMEAEFAFRMGKDLPPRASAYVMNEVLEAVGSLHPAIEIPDSRYRDFPKVGAPQLIADNACAHYFVLGPATRANWRAIDLANHPVRVDISGKPCEGKGSNVMGDPRIALTWLANELATYVGGLRMGDVVTTGTCIVPAAIREGDTLRADFGELGTVRADIGD